MTSLDDVRQQIAESEQQRIAAEARIAALERQEAERLDRRRAFARDLDLENNPNGLVLAALRAHDDPAPDPLLSALLGESEGDAA